MVNRVLVSESIQPFKAAVNEPWLSYSGFFITKIQLIFQIPSKLSRCKHKEQKYKPLKLHADTFLR